MIPAALPAAEAYRLWAPSYAVETAVTVIDDLAARTLTPTLTRRTLLDAGCGTGRRLRRAVDEGIAGGLGVDLVPEMLRSAATRPPVPVAAADVRALPARDASFDVVWCRLVLGHLADPTPAYRECARVLRPGGRLVVSDFHPDAAGHGDRRTFRDPTGVVRAVEHFVHTPEDHHRAAGAAGLSLERRLDLAIGPPVARFFHDAGRSDQYERQRGRPIVLALRFTR